MSYRATSISRTIAQSVGTFSAYCDEMEALLSDSANQDRITPTDAQTSAILNGEAASALRRLVPVGVRKKAGIFFTGSHLADKVGDRLAPMLRDGTGLVDPACGAGNLLITCAKHLPVGATLSETLEIWGGLISGYDLHPQFVRAARLRLLLLAASFHTRDTEALDVPPVDSLFRTLRVADMFHVKPLASESQCVVVNPPFGHVVAPARCRWGTGRVQVAALFLERILGSCPRGQRVVAILPDVLRSGTRYAKWREAVASMTTTLEVELAGRFDIEADVDVFILDVVARESDGEASQWPTSKPSIAKTRKVVSDLFDVRVGPVVPHRDPVEGPSYPYIHALSAPAWETVNHVSEERRYQGKGFRPPFVVMRRTSSPSDRCRSIANIINEARDVAIENHLMVLTPRDGSLQSCQRLLSSLKSPQSTQWLNQRIRCRHLTVPAVRELPLFVNDN